MAVHIATTAPVRIMPDGNVLPASGTIEQTMTGRTEMRVLPDVTYAPNSVNYPTIEEYLTLEDADGFNLFHMSNSKIVTSDFCCPTDDGGTSEPDGGTSEPDGGTSDPNQ